MLEVPTEAVTLAVMSALTVPTGTWKLRLCMPGPNVTEAGTLRIALSPASVTATVEVGIAVSVRAQYTTVFEV